MSGSAELLDDGPRAFDVPKVIARRGVTRPTRGCRIESIADVKPAER
jgi:hypothetical protein